MKVKYKKLRYDQLQTTLLTLSGKLSDDLPDYAALLLQSRNMLQDMYQTLQAIAAYNDKMANNHLLNTGEYTAFDEPASVKLARDRLQEL